MKRIYTAVAILLFFTACSKNNQQSGATPSICFPAFVRAETAQESAGTGWVVVREDVRSIPFVVNNLSNDFKVDGLAVNICVEETTEKISCNCSNNGRSFYRVVSISRR